MAPPKPHYVPPPRFLTEFQTATRLGMSVSTFTKIHRKLEKIGFPRVDDLFGGRDAVAIERWLDKRAGLGESFPGDNINRGIDEWEESGCAA